jgi:hypothetical protein
MNDATISMRVVSHGLTVALLYVTDSRRGLKRDDLQAMLTEYRRLGGTEKWHLPTIISSNKEDNEQSPPSPPPQPMDAASVLSSFESLHERHVLRAKCRNGERENKNGECEKRPSASIANGWIP